MSESTSHDAGSHIKQYLLIGTGLLVGTVITVLAAGVQMGIIVGITVAVIIATIKASLVAAYFMHLRDERKLIYFVLALTAAFCVVLIGLFLFAYGDIQGEHHGLFIVPQGHVVIHDPKAHGNGEQEAHGEHVP